MPFFPGWFNLQDMQNDLTIEEHPDWYYDVPVMKTLILGSFPPHPDRRRIAFYYPNPQNHFWRILARIAGQPYKKENDSVKERQRIMRLLKAGVHNTAKTIQRKGKSSLDTDISIVAYHDILSIVHAHPELEQILLPGYSAPSSTYRSFIRYLQQQNIAVELPHRVTAGSMFMLHIGQRSIRCVVLHSTSPAAVIPFEKRVEQFAEFLLPYLH